MENDIRVTTTLKTGQVHPDTEQIIKHFQLNRLPVEGTLFRNTYCSIMKTERGKPAGTAMIGLYSEQPPSISCFHRLTYDEIWHVYGGDPFKLYLLYPDGSSGEILMGSEPLKGHRVQFVIPAGTWQAGCIVPGGRYALFGCTMAPGFNGEDFEAADVEELVKKYPSREDIIRKLSINGSETRMPEGFER